VRARLLLSNRRGAVRYGAGLAVTVVAGLSVGLVRPPAVSFPAPAEAFAFDLRSGATSLQLAVHSAAGGTTQLTIVLGDREASFLHRGAGTGTYRLAVAPSRERRALHVEVYPPASVARVRAVAGGPPLRPSLDWHAAGPSLELPPPRPATADRPTADASVDETDTYGLRLFGVPVRSAPRITAPLLAVVSHGDRLEATCWAPGDEVTDGFPERPLGAYTSGVWFQVRVPSGAGFIPDVRFSRRGKSDRLNLPACAGG
jgi:hypothetical protein